MFQQYKTQHRNRNRCRPNRTDRKRRKSKNRTETTNTTPHRTDIEPRKTRKPTADTEPIARLPYQDHFATVLTSNFSGRNFDNAPTSCRQTLLIPSPHTHPPFSLQYIILHLDRGYTSFVLEPFFTLSKFIFPDWLNGRTLQARNFLIFIVFRRFWPCLSRHRAGSLFFLSIYGTERVLY